MQGRLFYENCIIAIGMSGHFCEPAIPAAMEPNSPLSCYCLRCRVFYSSVIVWFNDIKTQISSLSDAAILNNYTIDMYIFQQMTL